MPDTHPAAPTARDDGMDRARGRVMARSLMVLLDRVRGSREVLPHLAALERALIERGASAVDQLPPHHLGRICSQLSSLPISQDDPALRDLLGRLLDAMEAMSQPPGYGDFDPERTVVIREISHSEFAAVADEQATTIRDEG